MGNSFYQKINMNFDLFTFDDECGEYHHGYDNGKVRLSYFAGTHDDLWEKAYSLPIFNIRPDVLSLASITGNGFLDAHRDHSVTVSLNYYFEADKGATSFYILKDEFTDLKFKKNVFRLNEVDYVDQFIAHNGDAYLLNVNEIHSVDFPEGSKRKMMCFQWKNKTYKEVLASLNI